MVGQVENKTRTTHAYLAEFKQEKADPRPFDFGRSASWETWTESMNIDPVREARRASLFLIAGAERPLTPYIKLLSLKAWKKVSNCIYLVNDESTNTIIPFTLRPNNKYITATWGLSSYRSEVYSNPYVRYWSIGNPRFTSIKDETTVNLFCSRFHPGRVWTMIRFGETLKGLFIIKVVKSL